MNSESREKFAVFIQKYINELKEEKWSTDVIRQKVDHMIWMINFDCKKYKEWFDSDRREQAPAMMTPKLILGQILSFKGCDKYGIRHVMFRNGLFTDKELQAMEDQYMAENTPKSSYRCEHTIEMAL